MKYRKSDAQHFEPNETIKNSVQTKDTTCPMPFLALLLHHQQVGSLDVQILVLLLYSPLPHDIVHPMKKGQDKDSMHGLSLILVCLLRNLENCWKLT